MADRRIWEVVEFVGTPLGHFTAALTTAQSLPSVPTSANRAVIRTKTNGFYWTDDGQTPAATVGMYLLADETLVYDGDLAAFKMTSITGTADVRVAYYSR